MGLWFGVYKLIFFYIQSNQPLTARSKKPFTPDTLWNSLLVQLIEQVGTCGQKPCLNRVRPPVMPPSTPLSNRMAMCFFIFFLHFW
jgi:hypothetical protein